MATFLFDAHVFGPIQSRRLGSSLGINLLSTTEKVCNYDCIYCECGESHGTIDAPHRYANGEELLNQLRERLLECKQEGTPIDAITYAGNGEPTLHPRFPEINDGIIALRNELFPNAIIVALTNGATLKNLETCAALTKIDKAVFKLDAGDDDLLNFIDRPNKDVHIPSYIQDLKAFEGDVIIQTMFLKGEHEGKSFDNSTGPVLEHWLNHIEDIQPKEVMLYSIDRDTPIETLEIIPKAALQQIADRIEAMNIKTQVV